MCFNSKSKTECFKITVKTQQKCVKYKYNIRYKIFVLIFIHRYFVLTVILKDFVLLLKSTCSSVFEIALSVIRGNNKNSATLTNISQDFISPECKYILTTLRQRV